MIINKDALDYNFLKLNLDNILVETWFLSKEIIGSYKCNNLTIKEIEEIILYFSNINITEASLTYKKENVYTYKSIFQNNNIKDIFKMSALYEKLGDLIGITVNTGYNLNVYDLGKNLIEHNLNNSFEIFFLLEKNEVILTVDFQSIFCEDNRIMILLIYLMKSELLEIAKIDEIKIVMNILKEEEDLTNILKKIKEINRISVTNEQFQYIKYCVLKTSNDFSHIQANKELSIINQEKFNKIILDLGKVLGANFEKRDMLFPENSL